MEFVDGGVAEQRLVVGSSNFVRILNERIAINILLKSVQNSVLISVVNLGNEN